MAKEFDIDGQKFTVGDKVFPRSTGTEMGRVIGADLVNKTVTVEFTQKFNGKDSTREKVFPVDQVVNRTQVNKEVGKSLLKEINEQLKSGETISPEKAFEDSYKNGTMTEKVGNGIGLIKAHLQELKKDGVVSESKDGYKINEKLSPDEAAAKLDDINVETNMDSLVAKNAAAELKEGFLSRADSWIMEKTDAKAMGTGWGDFKSTYSNITKAAKEHSNQFYDKHSQEFAALDQMVTEVFAATYAAAAVTAKWGAKNLGRMAYNMAKNTFTGTAKNNPKINHQKQGVTIDRRGAHQHLLSEQAKARAEAREFKNDNRNQTPLITKESLKTATKDQNEAIQIAIEAYNTNNRTREQNMEHRFNNNQQSVWNSEEGKKIIADSNQKEVAQAGKEIKEKPQKLTVTQFTKKIESIKAEYNKELSALKDKYDGMLKEVEKLRPHEKENDRIEEKTPEKKEEKTESLGR